MAYEKRLCVLKQLKKGFSADGSPLSGAVYAERLKEELVITPRLAGLSSLAEGRYLLAVRIGEKIFLSEWKNNAPFSLADAPSLQEGFSALLCLDDRGECEPLAFGCCGAASDDFRPLLAELRKGRPVPVPMPPNQLPGAPSPQVPLAPAVPLPEEEDDFRDAAAVYDDEAIARTDYFSAGDEDETSARETKEETDGEMPCADETPLVRLPRGGLTYYRSVEQKLKEAFLKYPRDESLLSVFPHSEWVRTEGALLGVIYQEGIPRYLCVATPAPPEEVRPFAVFVPDVFSDEGGTFVVFQDAETGEYVRTELT